jgi:general secretion pathway protein C
MKRAKIFCSLMAFAALLPWGGWSQEAQDVLQLLGSISGKTGSGVALVKHRPTSAIKAIRIGEDVFGMGRLMKVDRFQMVLHARSGSFVTVSSRFGGASKKAIGKTGPSVNTDDRYVEDGFERNGNKVSVDARYRDRVLKEDLPKILMEASSEPVMENGAIVGFRLFQIDDNSMFGKLGIKEGDVIREINGVPLNDAARTVQLLNGLRNEPNIKVNVIRNGAPVGIDMNVR